MKKIVLLTGSSSSLGQELIDKLSANNFIVYAGSRDIKKIVVNNKKVFSVKLDTINDKDCEQIVEKIIKKEGKIDVLINVAGYSISGPTIDFTPQDFLNILNTNVVGAFRLIRQVVPYMKKNKAGKIINITSLSGLVAFPNFGLYSSSKFALEALGLSLSYELAKDNISVTNIAPGAIKSEIVEKSKINHKTAREKFKILDFLLSMVTKQEISDRTLQIIENSNPPASVILGTDAKIIYLLHKLLPSYFWNKLQLFIWYRK